MDEERLEASVWVERAHLGAADTADEEDAHWERQVHKHVETLLREQLGIVDAVIKVRTGYVEGDKIEFSLCITGIQVFDRASIQALLKADDEFEIRDSSRMILDAEADDEETLESGLDESDED